MRMRILCTVVCCWLCVSVGMADTFDWRRANVCFVITDRFCNGDPTNDQQYGRRNDYGSERLNAATFHGGDTLTECYSGQQAMVQHGVVRLTRYENGVAVFVRRK